VKLGLKEAGLQISVLTNRNRIQRHINLGKQAHHCNAQRTPKGFICRYGSYWEKEDVITWGGLQNYELVIWRSQQTS